MGFHLRRETEQQIEDRIKSGSCASADDVVLAGLKLPDKQEQSTRDGLDEARRKIAVGLQQLDGGEGLDGDAVFEELLLGLHGGDAK